MSKERISDYLVHLDEIHEVIDGRKDFLGTQSFKTDAELDLEEFMLTLSGGTNSSTTGSSSVSSASSDYDNQGDLEGRAIAGGFVVPNESSLIPIVGGKVQIPNVRGRHFKSRIEMGKKTNYAGYVKLPTDKFWFVESVSGPEAIQNNFAPDFADTCLLIYDTLVQVGIVKSGGKLQINSGFRKNPVKGIQSAHMCGSALDIGTARGSKDRYIIADALWGLGLRTIAVGTGYVHVEHFGEYHWSYDGLPTYRGPGSY